MNRDQYYASASAFDLHSLAFRPVQEARIASIRDLLLPRAGVILEIGAGSGAVTGMLLDALPKAKVLSFEPSASMRALAMQRIAARPDWFERVTLRPEAFDAELLPSRIGGAVLLGVLGHFKAAERTALFAGLARRLPPGGVVLFDLQPPERPQHVPASVFSSVRVGALEYLAMSEGEPAGADAMRWRVRYVVRDGDRVIDSRSAEYLFHHPNPAVLAAEAGRAGFDMRPLDEQGGWLLEAE